MKHDETVSLIIHSKRSCRTSDGLEDGEDGSLTRDSQPRQLSSWRAGCLQGQTARRGQLRRGRVGVQWQAFHGEGPKMGRGDPGLEFGRLGPAQQKSGLRTPRPRWSVPAVLRSRVGKGAARGPTRIVWVKQQGRWEAQEEQPPLQGRRRGPGVSHPTEPGKRGLSTNPGISLIEAR